MNKRQVHFIANCVYADHVAGGDIHFFNMARATIDAGYPLHFFGGHALKQHLEQRQIPATLTLTDSRQAKGINMDSLSGQIKLFNDYAGRLRGTLRRKHAIALDDMAYSVTDYWFDTLPVINSLAKRKLMILGMDAPSLRQVITRGRPDVTSGRINSLYYWLSQTFSLHLFRRCRNKRLLYVHPIMKSRLLRMGYRESELVFISNGFDMGTADEIPNQPKEYDVVWVGRWHRQKGIEDLLGTLKFLAEKVHDFRAVVIGKVELEMRPRLEDLGIAHHVHFAGLVSEHEKFRLFKASRLFLMPSTYESWGIVIGEALCSKVPVVAYDLGAYRPIFGSLIEYVSCFDREAFQQASLRVLRQARAGKTVLDEHGLEQLRAEHSWEAARKRFASALEEFSY